MLILIAVLAAPGTGGMPVSARAMAQAGESIDDDCEPGNTVDFAIGSAHVDLAAEAQLSEAVNWVLGKEGRYLTLVDASGPAPANPVLGAIRVDAAAATMVRAGVNPRIVIIGDLGDLAESERHALGGPDSVVVLRCGE
jgi:hypothetical protein